MPIARFIFITVDPARTEEAVDVWKQECGPLMISAPGCLSEKLLRATDAPDKLISYSEWQSREDIESYRHSDAHEQIKAHSQPLSSGERPTVELYEITG